MSDKLREMYYRFRLGKEDAERAIEQDRALARVAELAKGHAAKSVIAVDDEARRAAVIQIQEWLLALPEERRLEAASIIEDLDALVAQREELVWAITRANWAELQYGLLREAIEDGVEELGDPEAVALALEVTLELAASIRVSANTLKNCFMREEEDLRSRQSWFEAEFGKIPL